MKVKIVPLNLFEIHDFNIKIIFAVFNVRLFFSMQLALNMI